MVSTRPGICGRCVQTLMGARQVCTEVAESAGGLGRHGGLHGAVRAGWHLPRRSPRPRLLATQARPERLLLLTTRTHAPSAAPPRAPREYERVRQNRNTTNTLHVYVTTQCITCINQSLNNFNKSTPMKTPVTGAALRPAPPRPPRPTANLRTKILDFGGFDSSRILMRRGGTLRPMGKISRKA